MKKSPSLQLLEIRPMLKLKVLLVLIVGLTGLTVSAQSKLAIQGTSPSLYLVHTVVAKETWYSIGRTYNQSPKEIAPFNNTSMDKPLAIGQKIKVPLTDANFSQDGNKSADEVFIPLYHTVQEKEWMFRISTNFNKVSPENIQKWNGVNNDQLKAGMQLIVGYLKVKQSQSALASMGLKKIPATASVPVVVKETKIEDPKKDEVVVAAPAKDEPVKPEPIKEEPKSEPVAALPNNPPASHKGGSFRRLYVEKGNTTTGNAGVFKSTSGWNDGKYYALMNNVPIGTIVKVSFSSTNKTIYAKVLGQLPEMKESLGLTIRISDAAASELGVEINKFYVDVKY